MLEHDFVWKHAGIHCDQNSVNTFFFFKKKRRLEMGVDLCASPKEHNSFSVLLLDVKYDMKETMFCT